MAAYIHDLIGTWWSRGATGTPVKVSEVRYALEGNHLVRIGNAWASVHFEDGQPTVADKAWVRREVFPPPTWMDVREMIHDYLVRLQQLGNQQPYLERWLYITTRAFDPDQDRYEMGS